MDALRVLILKTNLRNFDGKGKKVIDFLQLFIFSMKVVSRLF